MNVRQPLFARLGAALQLVLRGGGVPAAWFNRAGDAGAPENNFTQPYAQSAWVFACIRKLTGPISSVELCHYDAADQEVEDPRLDAFWSAPALNADGSRMPLADFLECAAGWLALNGEVFFILDDTWQLPFPEVDAFGGYTPLLIARPDQMRPAFRNGQLVAWELTDGAGERKALPIANVYQVKLWNPYDPVRGLGPLTAAALAAEGDHAAGQYATNTAKANGDQGVYVVAKNGMLDDKQREQILSQLRAKRSAQAQGIFRPAFLTGDITIEDPKIRAVDVAFVAQRQEARKEIAAAFGVPPSFFDPQASYSIGSASDRFILIEEACKPLGTKLCGALARISTRLRGAPLRCELDWDEHTVMQQVRRERVDAAIKLWNVGMPMREVSDYLALDLPEYPGWDVGYLPFGIGPAAESSPAPAPATDPAYQEPADPEPPADPVTEMLRALRAPAPVPDEFRKFACSHGECEGRAPELSAAERRLWQAHMRKRLVSVRLYESKFNRVLMHARSQVLGKIAAAQRAPQARTVAADLMFDLGQFSQDFLLGMRNAALATLHTAGAELYAEVGKDDPWQMPPARALEFIAKRENKLTNVPADIFERIRTVLADGLNQGQSTAQLAAGIRGEFNAIGKAQGLRIAMTETAAAYGVARQEAMQSAGIRFKRWLTSGAGNVRAAHVLMNQTVVPISDPYLVTHPKTLETDAVQYPGDSAGAPWNVINCHCVSVAEEAPL